MIIDTHIWIWLVTKNERLDPRLRRKITKMLKSDVAVLVSVISCWEVSKLVEKRKVSLSIPLADWMFSAVRYPGIELQELTPEICIESCNLPGEFHGGPADQLLVATSRVLNLPLATMDRRILEYNHVRTV